MQRVPAAVLAIPLLAGSGAGVLLFDRLAPPTAVCAAGAAAIAVVAAWASAAEGRAPEATLSIVAGGLLAGLSLGVSSAREAYDPPLLRWFRADAPSEPVVVEGLLREDAALTPFGASMTLDVRHVAGLSARDGGLGGLRLTISGTLAAGRVHGWRAGRRIRAPVTLRLPVSYLNPGGPDDVRALARRGVALVGSAKSAALVEVVRDGSALDEASAAVRADARARLARAIGPWSARSAAVATAILIGDRTGLPAEDERRLQEAGTYHVIAISGGNIAILAGLLLVAGRALRLPPRAAASATILVLLFYGQVAGGAPSVGRAVTAAVIFLGARAIDHRGRPLNALGVAAGFAVARAPAASLDPGFILSFGATLGILAGTPALLVPPAADGAPFVARRMRAALRPLAALLAATVCAEIALAPAGASLFSRITFAGLLLNFAAIPLMTLVQIAAAAVLAFSRLWPGAAHACAYVAHLAATGLVDSARLVDAAPWLSIEVRPPAAWLIVVYYAAAGALVWFRRLAAAWVVAAAGMLLVLGPAFVARDQLPPRAGTLRVVVLDVGQGDATLVNLPDGRTLLVDAGGVAAALQPGAASPGGFDTGDRVVRPALRALGVRRLDALVITHGDPDHILGVPSVLQRVGARSVWEGAPVPPHAGLQAVAALAAARGASWRTVQAGDRERFGGADVRVLHPPPPDWERQRVRNEDSVVLELRLGSVSIVLPGDIGAEGERAILPRLERGRLVVLKAPHHGSATSSSPALLDVLRPAAAIFSAGRDNRFGHPHPAVVARYRALGTALFGTAEDGAVIVETDGTKVQVRGWTGRVMEFTK